MTEEQTLRKRAWENAWRQKNPEKERARKAAQRRAAGIKPAPPLLSPEQRRERDRLRSETNRRAKGIMPRPPKKSVEERKAVAKAYYELHKAERNEASRVRKLKASQAERLAKGLPIERKPAMTKEESNARRREKYRLKLRRARGLPDDYVFPKCPPRFSKTGEKLPTKPKAQSRKQKLSAERARRAAEVEAAKARQPAPAAPIICPDPPALVALFKKASKGEPARPLPPWHKKKTAFQIRGWV